MGTINDKLDKLNQTKTNIKNELKRKGADVKDNDTFASYEGYLHDLEIVNAQTKTVNPSTSSQTVIPDVEYNALSEVTVNPVTSSIDNNIQSYNIKAGVRILGVEGNVEPDKPDQNKTVNPSTSIQEVTADTGYELAKVTINPVTASIDSNIASNNIKSGVSILGVNGNVVELNGQTKTVTPTTSQQVITPDQNYNALTQVTVNAVPDETSILNEQDSLLSTQDIKISDLATALDNKIALDLTNATADANATASDIMQGKTAYVNGQKITGTIPNKPYIEVEYIAIANGNPYIDTNFKHTADTKVEIKFFASSTNLTNFVGLMGARQVNKNFYAYVFFTRFSNGLRFCYCRTGIESYVDGVYDKEITLTTYQNTATFTDGTTTNTITSTGTVNQGTNNFLLFNINTGQADAVALDSTNVSGTRIYYCKIWSDNGETLVRDFIPVIRKSTGKACLYDKVSQTFFDNQGTGDFVAGTIIE